MLGLDTNILLSGMLEDYPTHRDAAVFLTSLRDRDDVAISEFTLLELYVLLRNPTVVSRPASAPAAAGACEALRSHPRWQLIGFSPDSRVLHDQLWAHLRKPQFARRKLYDLRTALTLIQGGVTEFATADVKDFMNLGFKRVWNPLAGESVL